MKLLHYCAAALLVMLTSCSEKPADHFSAQNASSREGTIDIPKSKGGESKLEGLLAQRMDVVSKYLENEIVQTAVQSANQKNSALSQAELLALDSAWRAADGIDQFIKPYLTNPCSTDLLRFQEEHPGFSEIFITDAKGLNVCQTNKTSDLYQADEPWWIESFAAGNGHASHGEIEYDESARSGAISLYLPVRATAGNSVIGVAKAVLDITDIKF